ncbi:MAG: hypothetical protein JW929_03250 [Anaerolineales bacterium]|nr:hypothetical protein [Anaerolineales bacterium]
MGKGFEAVENRPPARGENPLQILISESAADELTRRLCEPVRPSNADLVGMLFRGAAVLSTMAAELGVILRIQIRAAGVSLTVDEEILRRAVNALVIHLLTVSQQGGWVTIGLEETAVDGRRGFTLRLTADSIILPWKNNAEFEEEFVTQPELMLCRKIAEKLGGSLAVRFREDNKLSYALWLPA